MDLKKLTDRAKGVVEKRGGSEGAKQDAGELADIAKGKGSLKDKARAAADAVKQPGAPGEPEAKAEPETTGEDAEGSGGGGPAQGGAA